MDLGKGRLRRNGLNALHSAVHPKHGLAWTDGKSVLLAPVSVTDEHVDNDKSMKLGEFEFVDSLYWSNDVGPEHCYLCVAHDTTVTLWKVDGCTPHLSFKQVRKIHATPIPQGCLWNPKRDIVCILLRDQCTFYFRHLHKRGSFSLPPIDSGKITCGCWSIDGRKLLVGIGSIIVIYQWDDIDKSISDFTLTAWKIPNTDGQVSAIAPVSDNRIVCTADLPLESLCKTNNSVFQVPVDVPSHAKPAIKGGDVVTAGPKALQESHKDALLNLKKNPQVPQRDYSQVVVFELSASALEPSKLDSVCLMGMLTPDVLYCDDFRSTVVVGSNACSVLHAYKVIDGRFHKVQEIALEAEQRPKGVCGLPIHVYSKLEGVLVLVGQQLRVVNTFLPSTAPPQCQLKLIFKCITFCSESSNKSLALKNINNTQQENDNAQQQQQQQHGLGCKKDLPQSLFKDSQLPNGNPHLHLPHFSSINNDLHDDSPVSTHSDNSQTDSKENVSVSDAEQDGSASWDCTEGSFSSKKLNNLWLLGKPPLHDNCLQRKSIEVLSESASRPDRQSDNAIDLDSDGVHTVDFSKQPANFSNQHAIECLSQNRGLPVINANGFSANVERSNSLGSTGGESAECLPSRRLKQLPSSNNLSNLLLYDSTSSLASSQDPGSNQAAHRSTSAADSDSSHSQIASMEHKLMTQESHILELHQRVDKITRLLEESSVGASACYKPVSEPQIVLLTLKVGNDEGLTKAFLLDNGRLQLDSVKEAFGLTTVELIIDGVSCVVGANHEGYIPVRFEPRETLYISGKRCLLPPPSFC